MMKGIIENKINESIVHKKLTEKQFWSRIDRKKGDKYITSTVTDWGQTHRGQGKRVGGMVKGAMSDLPKGKKKYYDILGNAPLSRNEKEEASSFETNQQIMLARALEAGFPSDVAFLVSYSVGSDKLSRSEIYKLAI